MNRSLAAFGRRELVAALGLAALLLWVVWQQIVHGYAGSLPAGEVRGGLLAWVGLGEPLPLKEQVVLELRAWRAVCAAGVGAVLAASGAMLQGLFRNPLASPSLLGVTTGASLGATLAILALGGYAGSWLEAAPENGWAPVVLTMGAFAGALAVGVLILGVSSVPGGVSVATLLLVGVAVNTFLGGAMATVQSLVLTDWDVSRAVLAWSFGTLDDRKAYHGGMVAVGLLAVVVALPWVARELDLFAGGEDDARALGVRVRRIRILVLLVTSFATGCAVATAGVVGFVGLVVPHLVRLWIGNRYLPLIVLSLLGGAVLLVGADLLQLRATAWWSPDGVARRPLQPGVLMSVLGGPVFFLLLLRGRREGIA